MTEFQKYIQRYQDLVPSENCIEEMKIAGERTSSLYKFLSEEQGNFAYAAGKWTLKEVLQHLIDAEKIFAYRALRFAREDKTPLPGWDEEDYGKTYSVGNRSVESLVEEFETIRKSSVIFFKNLDQMQLSRTGIANGNEISVEHLGKLTVGHNIHHLNVIEERYMTRLTPLL